MKTEKQIVLKNKEIGEQLFIEAKNLDKIITNYNNYFKWMEKIEYNENKEAMNFVPLTKEGLLQIDDCSATSGNSCCVIFQCSEIIDNFVKVALDCYENRENKSHYFLFSCVVKTRISQYTNEVKIDIIKFVTSELMVYCKQNRKPDFVQMICNKRMEDTFVGEIIMTFFRTMIYVNYIMEHPEIKEIERKKRGRKPKNEKANSNMAASKQPATEPKNININGIRFVVKNNIANKLKSKKIHRAMSCWTVRGHYRHYKNGRVVYIQSYEKGNRKQKGKKENSNIKQKTYTIE